MSCLLLKSVLLFWECVNSCVVDCFAEISKVTCTCISDSRQQVVPVTVIQRGKMWVTVYPLTVPANRTKVDGVIIIMLTFPVLFIIVYRSCGKKYLNIF